MKKAAREREDRARTSAGTDGTLGDRPIEVARAAPQVVISNGFGRFHLRTAAVEAARRGVLAGFITGGYPVPRLVRWIEAAGLSRAPPIGRFLARAAPVPDEHVHALWAGEPFSQLGNRVRGPSRLATGLADRLQLLSRRLYAASAARLVRRLAEGRGRGVYHYRAGFGGGSEAVVLLAFARLLVGYVPMRRWRRRLNTGPPGGGNGAEGERALGRIVLGEACTGAGRATPGTGR